MEKKSLLFGTLRLGIIFLMVSEKLHCTSTLNFPSYISLLQPLLICIECRTHSQLIDAINDDESVDTISNDLRLMILSIPHKIEAHRSQHGLETMFTTLSHAMNTEHIDADALAAEIAGQPLQKITLRHVMQTIRLFIDSLLKDIKGIGCNAKLVAANLDYEKYSERNARKL